jgi:hypothetical protein
VADSSNNKQKDSNNSQFLEVPKSNVAVVTQDKRPQQNQSDGREVNS